MKQIPQQTNSQSHFDSSEFQISSPFFALTSVSGSSNWWMIKKLIVLNFMLGVDELMGWEHMTIDNFS